LRQDAGQSECPIGELSSRVESMLTDGAPKTPGN
jgi:hypothetical protein